MGAAHPGRPGQGRQLAQGIEHLGRRALEQPPATAGEERVAAEDERRAVDVGAVVGDVARRVPGHVQHLEPKSQDLDVVAFGEALPKIRERIEQDLALRGLTKNKVLAVVVHLLEKSLIRVGNQEYAKQNKSFGLTTMRMKHVKIEGLSFRRLKGAAQLKTPLSLAFRRGDSSPAVRQFLKLAKQTARNYHVDER